jgi:hypothetical protein
LLNEIAPFLKILALLRLLKIRIFMLHFENHKVLIERILRIFKMV